MMKKKLLALAISTILVNSNVAAQDKNHAYAGLRWTIGHSLLPDAIVGYRNLSIDRDYNVKGVDLSLSYRWKEGFDEIKVEYAKGDLNAQGEIGVGYSLLDEAVLLSAGAQGEYISGAVNYSLGGAFSADVMLNSIGGYDKNSNSSVGAGVGGGGGTINP